MTSLEYYLRKLCNLNRATVSGSKAPHKPILLLSIIQSIEEKEVLYNKIYITPELVARFKDNWHHLVKDQKFTSNFSLPFYHLQSDKFWFLKTLQGREIALTTSYSIKSFAQLKQVVDYAYFEPFLFNLLIDPLHRIVIKQTLLKQYFNVATYHVPETLSLVAEIKEEILREPAAVYRLKAQSFDDEEVFIRSGVFKKVVPQVYNQSCCISGMRIIATNEVQMIDACHIIPFSESHDDTISNGISLCPNLHRAFDRGLISIDEDYKVVVSNSFTEDSDHYSIKQYKGSQIFLPKDRRFHPSLENLKQHYMRFTNINDLYMSTQIKTAQFPYPL